MDATVEEFVLDPAGRWEEEIKSLKKNAWREIVRHYDLEVRARARKYEIQAGAPQASRSSRGSK
ncbi:hypothetical protein E2C01_041705 [Portunus trituberculatus]|uniref:MADF domain-containing protein n=1 Tax=Portunus trituberculatus TaxID=210409 RepID=A0A5B7FUF5_PORTR|nr:hypothetical protein [Portunus trituberculatus]